MNRILAGLFALALLAPQANAAGFMSTMNDMKAGGLKLGPVEIHPYVGVSESYDSNIYSVPKEGTTATRQGGGVVSSWITKSNAGFKAKLPVTGMHSFDAGYDITSINYTKQHKANDSLEHRANVGYNYKGPMGITGRLADAYMMTRDPAFSESLGERQLRWQNGISAKVDYAPEGGRLVFGVSGDHTAHKYVDGQTMGPLLNRYEQLFGVTAGYKVMPKTKVWVGYNRGIIHYNGQSATTNGRDKNNKSHQFLAGVDGQLAPKLKGTLSGGLGLRKYDQNNAGRTQHSRNFIASGNLTWNPRPECTWNLGLSRSIQESTFGTNRFSIENNANLGINHKFPWKITGRAKLGMTVSKYPETSAAAAAAGAFRANRRDDTYTEGVGVGYDWQPWLNVGLDYEHSQRFSLFSGEYNFEKHLTMLSIKATF